MTRSIHKILLGAMLAFALVVIAVFSGSPARAIVGGTAWDRAAYPYLVQLRADYGDYLFGSELNTDPKFCSATVISPAWLLTAAHCLTDEGKSPVRINMYFADGKRVATISRVLHPLWKPGNPQAGHDLALIPIPRAATTSLRPVQVGSPGDAGAYAAGVAAYTMGWGVTAPSSGASRDLLVVDVEVHSDGDMNDLYNSFFDLLVDDHWYDPLFIGAGDAGHGACEGDSGGPLVTHRGPAETPVQIGVVSWGSAKCDRASAYAELNGAQLAWLATKVPSIMDSWPGCDAVHGTVPGTWKATYGEAPLSDGGRDGMFWWKIECLDTPNFPDTAEP